MKKLFSLISAFTYFPSLALAQSSKDWVKPATGFLENLEGGLVDLGALVAGIAILAYGFYLFINGRLEAMRLFVYMLAAVCITAGPTMIRGLINATS